MRTLDGSVSGVLNTSTAASISRSSVTALKQPFLIAFQNGGNSLANAWAGLPEAIDDLAQHRFIDPQQLGEPVLPYASLPKLQFEIRIHGHTFERPVKQFIREYLVEIMSGAQALSLICWLHH